MNSLLLISFSKTLEKEVTKDMVLKLEVISLYLYINIALIVENVNLSGKTHEERDLLQGK